MQEGEYAADAEGLTRFIDERLSPYCYKIEKESRNHDAIVNQTIGERAATR